MKKLAIVIPVLGLGLSASLPSAGAAVLFQDQMTTASAWNVNSRSADILTTFAYDYSADGIPEAPNTQVGDTATSGLKVEANLDTVSGSEFLTAYPLGQSFTGTYQLRFDAWMNFTVAGGGTTEFLGGGIGYDDLTADIASGAQVMATGDGGSSNDWRAFKSPPQFFIPDAAMAAGTHQGSNAYYANFLPAVAPPAAQGQAAGTGVAGSPGFQWITWQFTVDNNTVLVDIEKPNGDTLRIVDIDCADTSDGSGGCGTAGNISLFYADFFSSIASDPNLQFGLYDNVIVTDVPEPASVVLVALGGLMMLRRRSA
jgi:hypothetical protein